MGVRVLVPVFIVGIIVVGALIALIISKVKTRTPEQNADKRNAQLVFDANKIFNELVNPTDVDSASYLAPSAQKMVRDWQANLRKGNG